MSITLPNGRTATIGMRLGCRNAGQRVSESVRDCTLIDYDPESSKPWKTDKGEFEIAIEDHQPDMLDWIKEHVTE